MNIRFIEERITGFLKGADALLDTAALKDVGSRK